LTLLGRDRSFSRDAVCVKMSQ